METYEYVDHPHHYNQGGIECIDAIAAALSPEEFRGFIKGQVLKYTWRLGHKPGESPLQDLEKSLWYMQKLKDMLTETQTETHDLRIAEKITAVAHNEHTLRSDEERQALFAKYQMAIDHNHEEESK